MTEHLQVNKTSTGYVVVFENWCPYSGIYHEPISTEYKTKKEAYNFIKKYKKQDTI